MTTTVESITIASDSHLMSDPLSVNHDNDQFDDLPPPLQRAATAVTPSTVQAKRNRHSKKLSLNFPVFVPQSQDSLRTANGTLSAWTPSPSTTSPYRLSTSSASMPFPSPDALKDGQIPADGPDFLTLIAGQERRVMELKEELSKAESALLSLKKQWALFEAKKKQSELKGKNVKLGPVSTQTANSVAEDEEVERARRRELREQKMRELGMNEGDLGRRDSTNGKRNGGRVFAGRHTRTLSLLQNNNLPDGSASANRPKSKTESSLSSTHGESTTSTPTSAEHPDEDEISQSRRSLSRQATLQELIANSATGAAQMNFGKTYKDLASASRKSLPPGADEFVKQSKQVYDGVSQGFWSFVEDIRQATVGDEAVNGTTAESKKEIKKTRSSKKLNEDAKCDKHGHGKRKDGARRQRNGDDNKPEKDNFWKEFGLETPNNMKQTEPDTSRRGPGPKNGEKILAKDHESKSSTDSNCPPSLLADLMDVHEDDEAWDNWPVESPQGQKQRERMVEIRRGSEDTDDESVRRISNVSHRGLPKKSRKPSEAWSDLTTFS